MTTSRSAASRNDPAAADAWQATRQQTALATRLITDKDDYLAGGQGDVGRRTGPDEHELFVSCAPDMALQQQFEHLQPHFIAVHDLGTRTARKLLVGLAAAGGRPLQRLSIRRQGYGNTLATLEFVDLPTADGRALRLYSTGAEADTAARHGLARVLLGFSRVGAVLVGDLPGHLIGSMLAPFREAMLAGPWPNRDLLLLPLCAGISLATHGTELGRGTGIGVRATPQVSRPADVWGYLNGTWARLRDRTPADGRSLPAIGDAPSGDRGAERRATQDAFPARVERRARPRNTPEAPNAGTVRAAAGPAPLPVALLERYTRQVAALPGITSCCVFDIELARSLAACGTGVPPAELAQQGKALLAAIASSGRALAAGIECAEATITLGTQHLLLRALPGGRDLALHAVLDRASANLTLARLQIQRLDALFEADSDR